MTKRLVGVLCTLSFLWVLAIGSARAGQDFFTANKRVINGEDVTQFHGYPDLDAPEEGEPPVAIELAFTLKPGRNVHVSKLRADCVSAREGRTAPTTFAWNSDCEYDAASGKGVFRIRNPKLCYGATARDLKGAVPKPKKALSLAEMETAVARGARGVAE